MRNWHWPKLIREKCCGYFLFRSSEKTDSYGLTPLPCACVPGAVNLSLCATDLQYLFTSLTHSLTHSFINISGCEKNVFWLLCCVRLLWNDLLVRVESRVKHARSRSLQCKMALQTVHRRIIQQRSDSITIKPASNQKLRKQADEIVANGVCETANAIRARLFVI